MKPLNAFAAALAMTGLTSGMPNQASFANSAEYCMETEDGDYICLYHVRGSKRTPHINQVFVSVNGGNIESYAINCYDPNDVGASDSLHSYTCENYTEFDY